MSGEKTFLRSPPTQLKQPGGDAHYSWCALKTFTRAWSRSVRLRGGIVICWTFQSNFKSVKVSINAMSVSGLLNNN